MTLFSSQPGDEGLPGPARARVMAAIMTTTLMGVFDGTMINIALPSMAQEMQVPASIAVWFANGYLSYMYQGGYLITAFISLCALACAVNNDSI